jgi:dimethylamine--corrinoid protein Co-methyltransferase
MTGKFVLGMHGEITYGGRRLAGMYPHEQVKVVAEKMEISVKDLTNPDVTRERRDDLGIGISTAVAGSPKGIAAKYKIAKLLDIQINSVNYFKSQIESLWK